MGCAPEIKNTAISNSAGAQTTKKEEPMAFETDAENRILAKRDVKEIRPFAVTHLVRSRVPRQKPRLPKIHTFIKRIQTHHRRILN